MTAVLVLALILVIVLLLIWVFKLKKSLKEHFIIEHALQYEAGHDALTGLSNAGLALDRISQSIKNAKRYKKKIAVLYLGIDHFKKINRSFGLHVGDEVLRILSKRLLDNVRQSDTVARLSGDEFIIILDHFDDSMLIQSVIDKIMNISKEVYIVGHHKINITFSLGVSVYPDENVDSVTILNHASTAMHKVKCSGDNGYKFYTSKLADQTIEREKLQHELIQSLKSNEMEVYYQLQIEAKNNSITGMEALVRWRHPTKGLILPDQFIPLSEEIGFIDDIDKWVMKEAMTQFAKWNKAGLKPGILSLNLSVKSLEKDSFIGNVKDTLKKSGFSKDSLSFEIMETQIMNSHKSSIEKLNELSALGIKFSVDDFGTDYSSLANLKKLPINKLKIDRSFMANIPKNEDDKEIIKTIITMAKNLNYDVLAEGIETKEQRDFLLENSCSELQGYFYHIPSPANEVEEKLRELS